MKKVIQMIYVNSNCQAVELYLDETKGWCSQIEEAYQIESYQKIRKIISDLNSKSLEEMNVPGYDQRFNEFKLIILGLSNGSKI